jgi:transposase-like protein
MRTPELLSDPVYHDEEAARLYLQEVRWPDRVFCPFCGALDDIKPLGGESMGLGWFYCPHCQASFVPTRTTYLEIATALGRFHERWQRAFATFQESRRRELAAFEERQRAELADFEGRLRDFTREGQRATGTIRRRWFA